MTGQCKGKQETGETTEKQGLETGCRGGVHGQGYSSTKLTDITVIYIHFFKN